MSARASRKAVALAPPPAARRNGRPRSATAAARIYADLRAEMVSLARRPGERIVFKAGRQVAGPAPP